jgi:5'-nucleotidase (lipoprotein e(P4) family)
VKRAGLVGALTAALLASGAAQAKPHVPVAVPAVPAGMQYLYGSGEAAALSEQAYNALLGFVFQRVWRDHQHQPAAGDKEQAVLAPGATLADPKWLPCDGKPLAVVFDVDETILLNLGFEYDEALHPPHGDDDARWEEWEKTGAYAVKPVPGALETVNALRAMGVTVIFNTNRSAAQAQGTIDALQGAGFGLPVHGQTLFLKGDLGSGTGKDSRRAAIAARYCVLAMGGDQLGDFSDLFTGTPGQRRALASTPPIAQQFGVRWFVLPNPVYGAGLQGGLDDIFPADKRWPATPHAKEPN